MGGDSDKELESDELLLSCDDLVKQSSVNGQQTLHTE